jgi:hypothetical protein
MLASPLLPPHATSLHPPSPRLRSSGSPRNLPPHFVALPVTSLRPPSPRRLQHASITMELATGPNAL